MGGGRARAAPRATAAQRPERTNKASEIVASTGLAVACSEAVQTMGAWLARCGRVPVQRVARSHATVVPREDRPRELLEACRGAPMRASSLSVSSAG